MSSREQITALLNQVEQGIKDLEIAYELYFTGIEKRAPEKLRANLTKKIRNLLALHITQNGLKFKLNSLSYRYQSYSGRWDRILRMIDEGRYQRHNSLLKNRSESVISRRGKNMDIEGSQAERLYEQLLDVHDDCSLKAPSKEQVINFLQKQEEAIKKKFGDKKVEFKVTTEAGKPKIKVFAKAS